MVIGYKRQEIYDNQGSYPGECIVEIKVFESIEDYNTYVFTLEPKYAQHLWEIADVWTKP